VLGIGHDVDHPQAGAAREPRRPGRADRLDDLQKGHAARGGDRRQRSWRRLQHSGHESVLSPRQIPQRRSQELGRLLGRQAIPRRAWLVHQPLSPHPDFCPARPPHAGRSTLSAGHRPRVQEARPDQAAHQGLVARGQSIAAAHPRWRGRYDVDLEWTRDRAEGGGGAGRAHLERRSPQHEHVVRAQGRAQPQARVGIHPVRRATQTPGRVQSAALLRPDQSGGLRIHPARHRGRASDLQRESRRFDPGGRRMGGRPDRRARTALHAVARLLSRAAAGGGRMTQDLGLYETDAKLGFVTLNRPEKLNSLSGDLRRELAATLTRADEDPATSVVVLRGAGRSFCVGYDLAGGSGSEAWRHDALKYHERLGASLALEFMPWYMRKPRLASVQGHARGARCELAMFCDLTIAGDDAMFGEPEVRYSQAGPGLVMPWIIGFKKARELLYLGDMIDAPTALELGMVNRVVPRGDLSKDTLKFARRMALIAPEALATTKLAINRGADAAGFRNAMQAGIDVVAPLYAAQTEIATQFRELARKEGLGAALKWRKAQFER